MKLIRKQDGSVETPDGKIILFSVDRFLAEVANGDCCFICGAKPGTKEFNNEHVIPHWILRDRGLHSATLVLPNSASLMYGRYVIPCCRECNEKMAETFEQPISNPFAKGYVGIVDLMQTGAGHLLWSWLALIFLKLHLKHRELRWYLNPQQGNMKISEAYDWTQLHHVHCVVRSFYTGAVIDPRVYGSLFVVPASDLEGREEFDFANLLAGASMLLRIGPTLVFAVLNDSTFALSALQGTIEKISGPLTQLQGRELLANLCHRNSA